MDINFKTDTTAKAVSAYVFKKYGKPTQLIQKENTVYDQTDNAYRSSAVYLHRAEIIVIKNEIVPASPLNSNTSLNKIIQNYTPMD